MQKGEKETGSESIVLYRAGSQSDSESPDTGVKNFFEYGVGLGARGVDAADLMLERSIFVWGERCGKVRAPREILRKNEPGLQGMALGGQVVEQAPEANEVYPACAIGQGRILLAETAKPAKQMGISAEFREVEHLREI